LFGVHPWPRVIIATAVKQTRYQFSAKLEQKCSRRVSFFLMVPVCSSPNRAQCEQGQTGKTSSGIPTVTTPRFTSSRSLACLPTARGWGCNQKFVGCSRQNPLRCSPCIWGQGEHTPIGLLPLNVGPSRPSPRQTAFGRLLGSFSGARQHRPFAQPGQYLPAGH